MKEEGLIKLGEFYIAGVKFAKPDLGGVELLTGTKLDLVWEISNKFDVKAIRIDYEGIKLGYIPMGPLQDQVLSANHKGVRLVCKIIKHDRYNKESHRQFFIEILKSSVEDVSDMLLTVL
jgi:hypothetical protein